MTKEVFDQIAEGLREAIAVARGDDQPYKLHVPSEIDVKNIRSKTNMSQRDFASTFGFGLDQLKQWEQGRTRPIQANRVYLLMIEKHPDVMREMLKEIHVDNRTVDEKLVACR